MEQQIKKYAVIIGRFQPFHAGHQYLIDHAIEQGLTPIILIGSANKTNVKNPFSVHQRHTMIRLANPGVRQAFLPDFPSYEDWAVAIKYTIQALLNIDISDCVFYINLKEEDKCSFSYKGVEYYDHYKKVLELEGWETYTVPPSSIQICATQIRENLDKNKEYLNTKAYEYIKGLE